MLFSFSIIHIESHISSFLATQVPLTTYNLIILYIYISKIIQLINHIFLRNTKSKMFNLGYQLRMKHCIAIQAKIGEIFMHKAASAV